MRRLVRRIAIIIIAAVSPGIVVPAAAQESSFLGERVRALFFGEVDFRERENQPNDGFDHASGVAQVTVQFGQRFHAFTEMTATKKRNSDYRSEVERFSLHYAFSDQYKLSAGRYHTPVGYWNSAFHHGSWLQTTISRPRTQKFGPGSGGHFIRVADRRARVGGIGHSPARNVGSGFVIGRRAQDGPADGDIDRQVKRHYLLRDRGPGP